jgi:transcriptional regulator with XRE-family HTH domain
MAVATAPAPIGELLRTWRQRRNLSQLELALGAEVSSRHLSFLETGRARPSREMVIRLAEELEVPLRERNALLLAAGYAPVYDERPLDAPEMAPVRQAIDRFLRAHEPYPAVVVDRYHNLVAGDVRLATETL